LNGRTVPTYPEQTLTPEEFSKIIKEKENEAAVPHVQSPVFSASSFTSTPPGAPLTGSPTKPTLTAQTSNSFTFVSTLGQLQPSGTNPTFSFGPVPTSYVEEAGEEEGDEDDSYDDEDEPPMFEGEATVSVRYPGSTGS
jgi:hypothetical protein